MKKIFLLSILLFAGFLQAADLDSAVQWLEENQLPDGSYGEWFEHQTASAALGLRLAGSNKASGSLSYLEASVTDPESWYYGEWAEADIPGFIAFTLALTNTPTDAGAIAENLLPFQELNGGFKGYYDFGVGASVESSVDTAMALAGLSALHAIPEENKNWAVNYLFSVQNTDGSFNFTKNLEQFSMYTTGPDKPSQTALALIALKQAGYAENNPSIVKAINYLKQKAGEEFGGHVYAASLSSLAFTLFGEKDAAIQAADFVHAQQEPDGGFADSWVGYSNALHTGMAVAALKVNAMFKPLPPQLLEPKNNAEFGNEDVWFKWSAVQGAHHYRAKITRPDSVTFYLTLANNQFFVPAAVWENQMDGWWSWSVAGVKADGTVGHYSEAFKFKKV